jgi:ABC-type proline/glycine betaine transport system permease subunit
MEKDRKKGRGGWVFLATVVTAYGVTALADAEKALAAVAAFLPMLGTVAPVLLLVLALMILSERFFTPRRVGRWLGRDAGPGAWFIAVGAGALATGPIYPWYALLAELRRKGMPPALVAVLLYARAIKLPLLPLMAHYFGAPFTLALSGWILAFAWLSGLVMRRFGTKTQTAS